MWEVCKLKFLFLYQNKSKKRPSYLWLMRHYVLYIYSIFHILHLYFVYQLLGGLKMGKYVTFEGVIPFIFHLADRKTEMKWLKF